jgi:hypothetical protein
MDDPQALYYVIGFWLFANTVPVILLKPVPLPSHSPLVALAWAIRLVR